MAGSGKPVSALSSNGCRAALFMAASLLGIATAVSVSGAAFAQAAPATNLDEVVVTAQFKSERLQDTPLSISAVTGEMVAARNQTNIADVAHHVPNVFVERESAGNGAGAAAFIRGIGQVDPSFAVEPGVGIYVDDVYYGVISGSLFETLDLDRVEILRGPQGTLAGKNSIGGAIKLYSEKPNAEPNAYFEAGYGSFNRVNLRAATNLTIVPDKLFVRLSASGRRADGYFDVLDYGCVTGNPAFPSKRLDKGCKIGSEGGQQIFSGRAAFRWLISDKVEDNFIIDTIQDDSQNPAGKLTVQSPIWAGTNNFITGPHSYSSYATFTGDPGTPTAFSYPDKTTLHGWGVSNNLTAKLGEHVNLTSVTGYRVSHAFFTLDLDASPYDVLDQIWAEDHKQFTQEVRLAGDVMGGKVEWTVGGFYYDAKGISKVRLNIPGGLALGGGGVNLRTITDDPVTTKSKSAFGQVVFHATDKLSLTGALRYTDDEKQYTFHRYDTNGNVHPTLGILNGVTGSFSGDRVDYRVNANYKITDSALVYAQVSTGFKGGGINPRPYFPSQVVSFAPETLTGYEAGFKSDLFAHVLRLNGAVFDNTFKNLQGQLNSCPQITPNNAAGPCALATNIGDAKLKGAELEAQFSPTSKLTMDASLGYLNFKYTRVADFTGVSLDMISPFTPKWTGSFGVQYDQDFLGGTISPRVDYTYVSSTYSNAVNTPLTRLESRGLVNAKITWKSPEDVWSMSLAVSNVFDTFKIINHFQTGAPIYNAQLGQPTAPRQWLLTVKRNF
jgi:iron complex outermembrane receptor protein